MKWKNPSLKNYPRDRRGVAAVESALGTAAMITVSLLAFDLYRLASTQTTIMYAAVSLADTVSRAEPRGLTEAELRQKMNDFVQSLSELLHKEQLPTVNANFVVAAVYKSPGSASLTALWSKEVVLLGTNNPLTACEPANQTNEIKIDTNPVTLPADFIMADREIAIVAEVCVEGASTAFPRPTYAHYIVPSRDDDLAPRLGAI